MSRALPSILLALAIAAFALPAFGQRSGAAAPPLPPAARAIDLEEHLGAPLDGRLRFTDERGQPVTLEHYLGDGRPVILSLFYYRCPMLCGLLLEGMVDGLKKLDFRLGDQYRVVTASFDPRDKPEDARQKQGSVLRGLGRPEATASWPFLVGERSQSEALADSIGFRFAYDPGSDQYAHPAALVVLTPDGRISRYLYGVTFAPRDLRLALVEAGEGKVGTIVDRFILSCYRYDRASQGYAPYALGLVRAFGAIVVLVVFGMIGLLVRAERRKRRAHVDAEQRRQS